MEYDLSQWADNKQAVYLRWQMAPTTYFGQYDGWNIDDVQILGYPRGPAPTILSISKTTLQVGRTEQNLLVTGTNLLTGTRVRLVRSDLPGVQIWADEVIVQSSTQVSFDLNLNGVAPGVWDVQVVEGDGQVATLSGGLRLEGRHFYVNDSSLSNDAYSWRSATTPTTASRRGRRWPRCSRSSARTPSCPATCS